MRVRFEEVKREDCENLTFKECSNSISLLNHLDFSASKLVFIFVLIKYSCLIALLSKPEITTMKFVELQNLKKANNVYEVRRL